VHANTLNQHLGRIDTRWSAVFRTHRSQSDEANLAVAGLVQRYGDAIRRYLLASLQDTADKPALEFAMRLRRGDVRNAEPTNRPFRDFLERDDYHYGRLSAGVSDAAVAHRRGGL
jgi:hypothetical protein